VQCTTATWPRATGSCSGLVPRLLRALGPRGVLFVAWDEGIGDAGCCGRPGGGRIPTIVAGAAARLRARSGRPFDHYSFLRTIEDALGRAASANPRGRGR